MLRPSSKTSVSIPLPASRDSGHARVRFDLSHRDLGREVARIGEDDAVTQKRQVGSGQHVAGACDGDDDVGPREWPSARSGTVNPSRHASSRLRGSGSTTETLAKALRKLTATPLPQDP